MSLVDWFIFLSQLRTSRWRILLIIGAYDLWAVGCLSWHNGLCYEPWDFYRVIPAYAMSRGIFIVSYRPMLWAVGFLSCHNGLCYEPWDFYRVIPAYAMTRDLSFRSLYQNLSVFAVWMSDWLSLIDKSCIFYADILMNCSWLIRSWIIRLCYTGHLRKRTRRLFNRFREG